MKLVSSNKRFKEIAKEREINLENTSLSKKKENKPKTPKNDQNQEEIKNDNNEKVSPRRNFSVKQVVVSIKIFLY